MSAHEIKRPIIIANKKYLKNVMVSPPLVRHSVKKLYRQVKLCHT